MGVFHFFIVAQMVSNHANHHICNMAVIWPQFELHNTNGVTVTPHCFIKIGQNDERRLKNLNKNK